MTDVDEPYDTSHRLGVIQLERVMERERIDVDDLRLETGVEQ